MQQFNNRKFHKGFTRYHMVSGFTLIEILVAIAIIGVLAVASISIINPLEQIKKSRDAQRKQDLRQLQIALEAYSSDNNRYPAQDGEQINGAAWGGQWLPYIAKVPKDPVPTENYRYESDGRFYRLHAKLENCKDPQIIGDCSYFNYQVSSPNITIAALPTPIPTSTPVPTPTPPAQYSTKWGSSGNGDGQFNFPIGIAVDSQNNVYVSDRNDRIQKFTSSGGFLGKWGSSGNGDGQFQSPQDIAVDPSGNVYVGDAINNRIQKFDSNGNFLLTWGFGVQDGSSILQTCTNSCQQGILGNGDGQFNFPIGVAVDSQNNVYASDGNNRIQKFTSSGGFLGKWGSSGNGDGQFQSPRGIGADSSNNYAQIPYVVDGENSRIQKFTSSGGFLGKWGSSGTGDGQFQFPQDIAVDPSGNVYVTDQGNNRIQKFSP